MGRISGISTHRTDYNSEKLTLAMLSSVGVEGTSNADGFAAEKREQMASFGPWRLVLDGTIYNMEDFPSLTHQTSPADSVPEASRCAAILPITRSAVIAQSLSPSAPWSGRAVE